MAGPPDVLQYKSTVNFRYKFENRHVTFPKGVLFETEKAFGWLPLQQQELLCA